MGALVRQQFFVSSSVLILGLMDEETLEMMKKPRCGTKDIKDGEFSEIRLERRRRRRKRFVLQGSMWRIDDSAPLIYNIHKFTEQLENSKVRTEIARSFKVCA